LSPAARSPKIFLLTLGCPRNLVDSEVMAGKLAGGGYSLCREAGGADAAVVNTCAFIEDAKAESIDHIMQLAAFKKDKKIKHLIVTGCLAQRYGRELQGEIGEIDAVLGIDEEPGISSYVERVLKGERFARVRKNPEFLYDHKHERVLATPPHSAYVKIQEGCRNFCSYCIIPELRGAFRSRRMSSVIEEIKRLKPGRSLKEVNIIGQDTTLYGIDIYKKRGLPLLLRKISAVMKNGWVRLLYTHPAHYTEGLLKTIKDEKAICRYLDLPIQHISDRILKKMNRRTTKKGILSLIERIKRTVPGIALRTSLIVGFPGERDKDFSELLEFVREARFERLGVFTYSREEGTSAYAFEDQVPEKVKRDRFNRIMKLQQNIAGENNKKFLGKEMRILIDSRYASSRGSYIGRSEYDAPEVDGTVFIKSASRLKTGDFINVRIDGTMEYDLTGTAL